MKRSRARQPGVTRLGGRQGWEAAPYWQRETKLLDLNLGGKLGKDVGNIAAAHLWMV